MLNFIFVNGGCMRYLACHDNAARDTFDFPIELYHVDKDHPRYEMPLHWHIECEIIFVLEGVMHLSLDGEAAELAAGESLFVSSGVIHGGHPENCVYDCIVFDMERFANAGNICREQFNETLGCGAQIRGRFSPGSDAGRVVRALAESMRKEETGYEFVTAGLLWQFFGFVIRDRLFIELTEEEKRASRRALQVKNSLRRIRCDYALPLTLTDLADEASMAPQYFCRVFRHVTGRAPIDYLNFYRVDCAAELLQTTRESITEIAQACGFTDLSYFTKLFRRYKGVSAGSYRKAHSGAGRPGGKRLIALTFDDGPDPKITPAILELLERYGVVASFFVCGDRITEESIPIMQRAALMGCEIDNHSRTHAAFTTLTPEQMLEEISYTTDKIVSAVGVEPRFFRPPYIAVNEKVMSTVPLTLINGYSAEDWLDSVPAEERSRRVLEQARDGAIILMHDSENNWKTVEALDTIIPALLSGGYRLVTCSALFSERGIDPTRLKAFYSSSHQTTIWPKEFPRKEADPDI